MRLFALSLIGLMLAGCSKTASLAINPAQTRVLDASVVAAGITVSEPAWRSTPTGQQVSARIHNASAHPVTVSCRFYWYDQQGLEVMPVSPVQTVVVPAYAEVDVTASRVAPSARQVRLYLFL
ncbi:MULTISPECIES: YcfL family protein [Dickeya]|uniref:YcfL protein: an outer membrane lipoprotein that is part of a salvage cluster n=1 Tax=Dickeya aquatica TaxID=1401087 RepID=A0A375ACM4_9GAMM|nr:MULTISPECIES: DUF1425 domain-containing protein [Dickeya]SLM63681.1 YcfL protein: an outer membrane lipoprotein that is part of a salvage cluster [Dickeya aquatica]